MAPVPNGETASNDADLALDPRRTRFVDAETERRYDAWSFERARRGVRASLRAALVIWVIAIVLLLSVARAGVAPWVLGSVLALAITAAAIHLLRTGRKQAFAVAFLASFPASGLVGIGIARVHLQSPGAAIAICVWACFFQLQAGYVRVRSLAAAVAPTCVAGLVGLVHDVSTDALGPSVPVFGAFLVVSAYVNGVRGAVRTEESKRRSFRQSCIIERQAATIARERARTEAVLSQELRHQVAERSRELGAVLARSDVSLDVGRLSPGERFAERYRVVSLLGAGGMGVVYEVERLTDGQRLALKALTGRVSGPSAARFAREAEIGARVHHPHVVSILDVGVASGVPFLAMELVTGGSLEAQRARFGDVGWALPILRQIALGLAALHDAGAVHRDLKPANVLLAGDESAPVAKISDFGISRFGPNDEHAPIDPIGPTVGASPPPRASELTATGVVMGTPLYMAPEAMRGGRALDAAADVWALGLIAYELLSGKAAYALPAWVLVQTGQPIPAAPFLDAAGVSERALQLFRACLALDPVARPRVRQIVDALPTIVEMERSQR